MSLCFCIVVQLLTVCSQPHCFNSLRVNIITTVCAVHVSTSFVIRTTSLLDLNTRRNALDSAQHFANSPKGDLLVLHAQGFDQRVLRHAFVIPINTDVASSPGMLQRLDFELIR